MVCICVIPFWSAEKFGVFVGSNSSRNFPQCIKVSFGYSRNLLLHNFNVVFTTLRDTLEHFVPRTDLQEPTSSNCFMILF